MLVSSLELMKLIIILLYVFLNLSKLTKLIKISMSVFSRNERFCSLIDYVKLSDCLEMLRKLIADCKIRQNIITTMVTMTTAISNLNIEHLKVRILHLTVHRPFIEVTLQQVAYISLQIGQNFK